MKSIRVEPIIYFKKRFERLARRYLRIGQALEALLSELRQGEKPGDKIPNVGYDVYKVRLANPDAQKGKSGRFRVIYYVQLADRILLLTIYDKARQDNISPDEIRRIIEIHVKD